MYDWSNPQSLMLDIENDAEILKEAPKEVLSNSQFISKASEFNAEAFAYAIEDLRDNRQLLLELLKINPKVFKYASKRLQNDKELVLIAVSLRPLNIKFCSDTLKNDKDVVLNALSSTEQYCVILEFLSATLQDDDEVAFKAIDADPRNFEFISPRLKNNRVLAFRAVNENTNLFKHASDKLRDDTELALLAFSRSFDHDSIIDFCSTRLKADEQFILKTLEWNLSGIRGAADSLKNNKNFALRAISIKPLAYQYLSDELKADPEVFFAAYAKDPNILGYAPPKFKVNTELLLKAVEIDRNLIANKELQLSKNKAFLLSAIKNGSIDLLNFADKDLRQDKEFMLEAIVLDESAFIYADNSLLQDEDFNSRALEIRLKYLFQLNATFTEEDCRDFVNQIMKVQEIPFTIPNRDHLELYEQVKSKGRLGRLNLTKKPDSDFTVEPARESFDSFSSNTNHLGQSIVKHFGNELALFEYSIFYPKTNEVKGVILSYYGGFFNYDFQDNSQSLYDSEEMLITNGYIVVKFLTHDNWQTIHQSQQMQATGPGNELLNKTLQQLLLFARALKERFSGIPLVYFGGSFGATKGALVNLLLSNKNKLEDKTAGKQLPKVTTLLNSISKHLFNGFILHDGAFKRLKDLTQDLPNSMQIPALVLQNFDDERVTVDQSLDFIAHPAKPSNISFVLTPQGADSVVQKGGSTEGHFRPNTSQYQKNYDKSILQFLSDLIGIKKNFQKANWELTKVRHTHGVSLFKNADDTRAQLYRLYFALLHHEKDSPEALGNMKILPVIKRIHLAISIMAHSSKATDKQVQFNQLFSQHAAWLFIEVMKKRIAMLKLMGKGYTKHRAKPNQFFQLAPAEAEKKILTDNSKSFTLTEGAQEYLKHIERPLDLIQSSRLYAIVINQRVLDYFKQHSKLEQFADLLSLWGLDPNTPANLTIDLTSASRALSIISLYYPAAEQIQILEIIQASYPITIAQILAELKMNQDELKHFVKLLMQQPENKQRSFISLTSEVCKDEPNKIELMDWLNQLDIAKRSHLVEQYSQAKKHLGSEELSKLIKNPELLETDFMSRLDLLEEFKNSLK